MVNSLYILWSFLYILLNQQWLEGMWLGIWSLTNGVQFHILAEFGDYERSKHKPGYLHSLKLTSDRLSDDLNTSITQLHRDKLRYINSKNWSWQLGRCYISKLKHTMFCKIRMFCFKNIWTRKHVKFHLALPPTCIFITVPINHTPLSLTTGEYCPLNASVCIWISSKMKMYTESSSTTPR